MNGRWAISVLLIPEISVIPKARAVGRGDGRIYRPRENLALDSGMIQRAHRKRTGDAAMGSIFSSWPGPTFIVGTGVRIHRSYTACLKGADYATRLVRRAPRSGALVLCVSYVRGNAGSAPCDRGGRWEGAWAFGWRCVGWCWSRSVDVPSCSSSRKS